jgi:hypothetical protein
LKNVLNFRPYFRMREHKQKKALVLQLCAIIESKFIPQLMKCSVAELKRMIKEAKRQ